MNTARPILTAHATPSESERTEHEAEEQQNNDWEKSNVSNTNEEN